MKKNGGKFSKSAMTKGAEPHKITITQTKNESSSARIENNGVNTIVLQAQKASEEAKRIAVESENIAGKLRLLLAQPVSNSNNRVSAIFHQVEDTQPVASAEDQV
jgi:hypothetical protein